MIKSIMNALSIKVADRDPSNSVAVDRDRSQKNDGKSATQTLFKNKPGTDSVHSVITTLSSLASMENAEKIIPKKSTLSFFIPENLEAGFKDGLRGYFNTTADEEKRPLSTKALKHRNHWS